MNKTVPPRIGKLLESSKVRYLISGGVSFVAEYGFFAFFNFLGWSLFVSNSLSFSVGLAVSFTLHKLWSFSGEHKDSRGRQAASYITLALVNLALTNVIIGLLVNMVHTAPLIAKILCMVMIVIWNYLIMSRLIFRKRVV